MNLFNIEIEKLIERYNELTDWLYDNTIAETSLYEERLRERNILSVRIHNYYHDNKFKET